MRALDALTQAASAFVDLHGAGVFTAGIEPDPFRPQIAEGMVQKRVEESVAPTAACLIQRDAEQFHPA